MVLRSRCAIVGSPAHPAAYATAAIPGTGGRLKVRPEDFLVEEIPAYEPSGQGEHLCLLVEKTNLSTLHVVRVLAQHFGVRRDAVGFAGLKDKRAVTRQMFTVHTPGRGPSDFPALDHAGITIHWVDRHANKLRRGHLRGNRFIIRVRDVDPSRVVHAHRTLSALAACGVPNRIGEQRFGHLGNNHLIGRGLLLHDATTVLNELLGPSTRHPDRQAEARSLYAEGRYAEAMERFPPSLHTERRVLAALARGQKPHRAVFAIERTEQAFYITAFQSAVFNEVLDRRLASGLLDRMVPGDLAFKHDSGAVFPIGAAEAEDPSIAERLRRLEISPSGPMWGARMMRAEGAVDAAEVHALEAHGMTLDLLRAHAERSRGPQEGLGGERRPLRVPLSHADVEGGVDEHGPYIKCVFELPRGSFATTVMAEVMKPAPSTGTADEAESDNE